MSTSEPNPVVEKLFNTIDLALDQTSNAIQNQQPTSARQNAELVKILSESLQALGISARA